MALNCPEAGKELATIVEGVKLQMGHMGLRLQAPGSPKGLQLPGLLGLDLKLREYGGSYEPLLTLVSCLLLKCEV